MKLYDWTIAPNPRRVRMYLAEKGIEVECVQAAQPGGLELDASFLEISDRRRVPLLELDDGTHIGEAMAICRYFEALHPEPPLFGRDAKEAGLCEMWERESDVFGMHAAAECVRNEHPAFKDRALPGYAPPTPQLKELVERGRMRYNEYLTRSNRHLATQRYFAGEHFTVADITAFCTIDFWAKFGLAVPEDAVELQRWFKDIAQRPSTQA